MLKTPSCRDHACDCKVQHGDLPAVIHVHASECLRVKHFLAVLPVRTVLGSLGFQGRFRLSGGPREKHWFTELGFGVQTENNINLVVTVITVITTVINNNTTNNNSN